MNTIFNKVDPAYINCMNGICEHAEHKVNSLWWLIPAVILSLYIARKFKKTI
mgnify:CR=1 FL=1|jgi:hypothetical protein